MTGKATTYTEVRWREGSTKKAKASDALAQILALEEKNEGPVEAKDLVEDSRNPKAALHSDFEWNDDKAAGHYRENQARNIIRSLIVNVASDTDLDGEGLVINVFDSAPSGPGYRQTLEIIKSDERHLLLEYAKSELSRFRSKYGTLIELARVIDQIDVFLSDEL